MTPRLPIEASPVHKALWDPEVDLRDFDSRPLEVAADLGATIDRSLELVWQAQDEGTLYGEDGFVSDQSIRDLGRAGYWAVPAPRAHGGLGGTFAVTAALVSRMAEANPYVAGLMSTHACLGPVGLLSAFGTQDQQARLLPPLARGERLGAFAVTEPVSSSDWNALRCTARRDGRDLLLTGEKFLITNAAPGRTVSVLCRVDGRFELLVVELPGEENEHFQVVPYEIAAPKHIPNAGLRFNELRVPAENVISVPGHDGKAAAHFSLNRGRVAIVGFAAGFLRRMAAELVPWVHARRTFGAEIATREMVQLRLGRLAARIAGCDAMLAWAAQKHDEGHHGQLECVTAKVFASEAATEALTQLFLKTMGGRSFLKGGLFTDYAFDLMATPVYEGENEIVTLGMFRSLSRAHGRRLAELDESLKAVRSRPGLSAAVHAGKSATDYARWSAARRARSALAGGSSQAVAARALQDTSLEISSALRRLGAKLASREALELELTQRVQLATTLLVVSRFGDRMRDELIQEAAHAMADELSQRLTGARSTAAQRERLIELGAAVANGRFPLISRQSLEHAPTPRMYERLEPTPPSETEAAPHLH